MCVHYLFSSDCFAVTAIPEVQQNRKYRFRKRDKVKFYATKVLRKVS